MYDTAFNKIERELRNEEGVANELDYVEQTSWVLFLKYLHDLEAERRDRAELDGTDYKPILSGPYAWDQWAAPKTDEQFDHNKARIGEDLIQFVDTELFPYLASFRQSASGPRGLDYKIGGCCQTNANSSLLGQYPCPFMTHKGRATHSVRRCGWP